MTKCEEKRRLLSVMIAGTLGDETNLSFNPFILKTFKMKIKISLCATIYEELDYRGLFTD